jgi:antitoxin MazE
MQSRSLMEAVIRKWGNSPTLRLPSSVLTAAGFALGQRVNLVVSCGCIEIQPANNVAYNLDKLLAGVTKKNSHGEVSLGAPVGREIY